MPKKTLPSCPIHTLSGDYIREWLVLGPFFPQDLRTDFLADAGGEAGIRPQEGNTIIAQNERTLKWKGYRSRGNIIDLTDAIGQHTDATAYAFCFLQSNTDGDIQIQLGSDDGAAMWINGQQVYDNPIDRPLIFDDDVFEADVEAGMNSCLVKVSQGEELWGFAMRAIPPERAVVSGIITDKSGAPSPNALVSLEQHDKPIAQTQTNASGYYGISVYPADGLYNLSAVKGDLGKWQMNISLREGGREILNIALEKATSISGTLLTLDRVTPHVMIPVQAISEGRAITATWSDERGQYRFVNLRPGSYQVRTHVLGEHLYYGEEKAGESESQNARMPENGTNPISLQIEAGKTLTGIDFYFAPFKKGKWVSYDSTHGLADNHIADIHHTPDGRLWFATRDGISQYDGRAFTKFDSEDDSTPGSANAIHADSDGVIWSGAYGTGVFRYDGKRSVSFTAKDGLVDNRVVAVHCASDGTLWFGTRGGVSRFDGETFVNITPKDGLAHYWVNDIYVDPDGVAWLGTAGGISWYDHSRRKLTNLSMENGLVSNYVKAICRDDDGIMWFGTDMGVSRYDGRTFMSFSSRDGLVDNHVDAICCDSDGVIWFGTSGGVSRYDGKVFVSFTTKDGLANNDVRAIHDDPGGMLWFGTWSGGVSCYDRGQVSVFTSKDGLVDNDIRVIHSDPAGAMWIGTSNGVSRYDGERFTNFTREDGLAHNVVKAIHCASDSVTWFGTGCGVSRYDGKGFSTFTTEDGLAHNDVTSIHGGTDGEIWFGTAYGVSCYDGREFLNFDAKDGLAGNVVLSVYGASDGAMWFGTRNGLSQYSGREFTNFTTSDGLADNSIHTIYSAPDGVTWLGMGHGVSRYDGKEFQNFTTRDGLAHNLVNAIYCDCDGVMWFGTDGGVSSYDGITFSSLDTRDGLAGNAIKAIYQGTDGCLWFGTDKGLTRYGKNTVSPRVHIVAVTTDTRHTDLNKLPPAIAGAHVTFECTMIDFRTHPQKQLYRYKLEGYDKEWSKPTNEDRVDYTDLPVGEYNFLVQAIDRDLNYSEPDTAHLTVKADPELTALQVEVDHLRQEVAQKYHFENIVGHSEAIRQMQELMEKAIDSGLTVLISGETGVGKEQVARAIHYSSPRKDRRLLSLNCGAVPKDLMASTLFGHCKGAFTGAYEDKIGLFGAASGGTLVLDEIGEMPPDVQVHLLRVLEEHEIQRLGEHKTRSVDVRVIAITNRDLPEELTAGSFRADLYYRLSEFPIRIPPLRERPGDIPLLAEHFLQEMGKKPAGFAPDVFETLQNYHWPGNVRELRNTVRLAAAMAGSDSLVQLSHFPSHIAPGESLIQGRIREGTNYSEAVDSFRRRFVIQVLEECGWNRHEAARRLRMHRANLLRLMKRLGIENRE